jgi:hypothetical protein
VQILNPFDSTIHHIGLKQYDDLNPQRGFILAGSWTRAFRRQMQSEFEGVKYGQGESLVNKPGVSSWSMDDFTGGEFQYVFGKDPAMVARHSNIIPSQFDRSLRSVPPLKQWINGTNTTFTGSEIPLNVFTYNGYLFAIYTNGFYRWNLATGVRNNVYPGGSGSTYASCFLKDRGHTLHCVNDVISAFDLDVFVGWSWTDTAPVGAVGNITGITGDGERIVSAHADVIWTVQLPDTRTSPPVSNTWTRIGRLPGRWKKAAWASGLLYILCVSPDAPTQLVAFDGTQILPICDFPYNFDGESLVSYGGRIYVGGSGADIQTDVAKYAELYEVTGTSVRLLKTFAPESLGGGGVVGTNIYSMVVHEGMLFFGVKGVGLVSYDLTLDAFFGASIFHPADASAEIRHLTSGRNNLFTYIYPWAADSGKGVWMRPSTSQETTPVYTSEIETSDFAMSFDRLKSWRQLRCLVRFPQNALACQYSTDGGATFTSLPTPVSESSGRFRLDTFDLTSVPKSRTIRFKFIMDSQTNVSQFREFVSFTASFRLLDSDSVGSGETEKLAWTFVIVGSETVEALDGSTVIQDVSDIHRSLWDWASKRTKLAYTDTDGTDYTVEIDDLRETVPFVLPPLPPPTGEQVDRAEREAFYQVTLVES